ncbi:hypothetical protein CC86DRAFT_404839 [Ophiobolus disseminans]|uniref:Uncharacterized protein n=1 Tax=Ophiobolus disseminans TaxID=1469910 RepID=A0A6A7A4P0_9PLEO|nr:hypothetical protein CC86DRAFT_404839 [Ophiobolus disseminans]
MSYHQNRQAQSDNKFNTLYSACSGLSLFHDLRCGHRVQSTSLSESCGVTCLKASTNAPFVCPDCIVADVRLDMIFESISLSTNGDDADMMEDGPTRDQLINAIADAEIKKRLAKGYRMCKIVKKCDDPLMQFFSQFMEEEGFGGIDGIDLASDTSINGPLKRPMRAGHQENNTWMPRETSKRAEQQDLEDGVSMAFTLEDMERDLKELQDRFKIKTGLDAPSLENLAEKLGRSHIEEQREDDAMAAVQQALKACALGAATTKQG